MVLLGEDLLDLHHVEHCLADVGVSAPLNLFSVEKKKMPGTVIRTHLQTRPEGYEPNELPGEKKERKIQQKRKKEKKKKHLTVVDPETLFMRNSKLLINYCPKTCIA